MNVRLRKATLLSLLLMAWLVTSACFCSDLAQRLLGAREMLADRTPAMATKAVEATPAPMKEATPRGTDEPGTFTIELTEDDILDMLADQSLSQDTVTVGLENVTLGEGVIRVGLQVSESETGLDFGVTVVAEPYVSEGQVYARVISLALDESISGFGRRLAQAALEEAIDQATEGQGIPIPVEDVEVLSVDIQPGMIVIRGRRP
ncbi:MAG: hypothetical protein ACP5G7_01560 [Anaerolineae bacterium]